MSLSSITSENWFEDEDNFVKAVERTNWDEIPLLNSNELHNLRHKSLVRFQGMIQDMHSPEYYLEKFEVFNPKLNIKVLRQGKYTDAAECNDDEEIDFDSVNNITGERNTFVVISVPCINNWVKNIQEEKFKISQNASADENKAVKRLHDDDMDVEDLKNIEPCNSEATVQKKQCMEASKELPKSRVVSTDHILNFPIPDRIGKVSQIKLYKNADLLKVNDLCEFVGFLSVDPSLSEISQNSEDDMNSMEVQTHYPPASLVPRIHCVSFKKMRHNNPLAADELLSRDKVQFLRRELLIVLTQLLLGDQLAAEYLLLHLLSEVYLRKNFLALGKFSLNVSNVPVFENLDFVQELYKFIELLVPKSHYLPMTLENMNDLSFTPKKDYECNRLTSGILQLSANTHLILDETKLSNGRLNASGVNSIKAISSAIKNQKVVYDFKYYPLEFDSDIPFLIFSEGKSLLPVDCHIKLKPDDICLRTYSEIIEAARHFLKPELLNDIRVYLTLARLTKYEIAENVEELVQSEFVNMRQEGKVSAEDLHNLLVLARLISISHGKTTLDDECWKKACSLEQQRKARLAPNN